MELFLLVLLVPLVWLAFLPSRFVGTIRRHRWSGFFTLAVLLFGGWAIIAMIGHQADAPTDYSGGDAALRAMLE